MAGIPSNEPSTAHEDNTCDALETNIPKLDGCSEKRRSVHTADQALERLKAGNLEFLRSHTNSSNISQETVRRLYDDGQHPFAVIIACSDSRVAPEHVFMAGLGDLFTIRTAGNAVGNLEAASAYYAASHLHAPLIVVMGHTQCGAITSAQTGNYEPIMAPLLNPIAKAIGPEKSPYAASERNVRNTLDTLKSYAPIALLCARNKLKVIGAMYRTSDGQVDFLPEKPRSMEPEP